VPRRVVLLTRDASLVVAVKALLADDDRVTELESPQELPPMGDLPVDAVVVDLPGASRAASLERVRGRFSGPLVLLLGHGEDPAKARGAYHCSVLARPFGMSQLWSLLVDSTTEAVTEVIPVVQRRDPSQRPSPGPERSTPVSERPGGAPERPGGGPERPDRPPERPERPQPPPEPEPERPARVSEQPDLAPERQDRPQVLQRPEAPAGESPRESTGPQAAPGERPQRSPGPPSERQSPVEPPAAAAGAERVPQRQAPAEPPAAAARPERAPDRPAPPAAAAREGESGAARAAPVDDRRGGAGSEPAAKDSRRPPPWNWRSRRFKQAPTGPVDPGALTQPMPAVPPPANGVPPAPRRPGQPPEPAIDGVAPRAEPRSPAPRVDRQDRAPAVEPRDPAPPADRRDRAPSVEPREPGPAVDRRDRAPAPEPRDVLPALDRREPAPPADRRDSAPVVDAREPAPPVNRRDTAPAFDPRGTVPTVEPTTPAPKVDRPDAAPAAEPRVPEPAAERRDSGPAVDPLNRASEATPPHPSAPHPSGSEEVSPDPPEAVAGRLAERLEANTVALLLDNNHGLLEVAGGIGLTAAERQLQVEYGHEVLLELFRVGVGLIEDTERVRGLISGIPGCNSQSLVMVPLVHEGHGFGALIIGRTSPPGQPRPEFTEPEIEALMDFAEDVAAPLRSTVLLRRLKGQLNTPNRI
jgi:hypothetical protein